MGRLEAAHRAAIKKADDAEFETAEHEEADDELAAACSAVATFESETLLATPPTTRVGALALLSLIAERLHEFDDDKGSVSNAIRNALAVLEREALA
jgi:hypothetical protein